MDLKNANPATFLKMLDWKIRSMEKEIEEKDKRIEELEFKLNILTVHN